MEEEHKYQSLIFSLVWTIFFGIIGIILASVKAGAFTIYNFFVSDYKIWLNFFIHYRQVSEAFTGQDLLFFLVDNWYYFFFTGGILALLWELIHLFFNFLTRKRPIKVQTAPKLILPPAPAPIIQQPLKQVQIIEKKPTPDIMAEIESLLKKGQDFLNHNKVKEAEETYNQIRRVYNSAQLIDKVLYYKIGAFFKDLVKKRQENAVK